MDWGSGPDISVDDDGDATLLIHERVKVDEDTRSRLSPTGLPTISVLHLSSLLLYSPLVSFQFPSAIATSQGGHINPTVTFGLLLARNLSLTIAVYYMVMQCLGAICGAGVVKGFMGNQFNPLGGGANVVAHGYTKGSVLGAEIIGTFVLVYIVFSATDAKRSARDSHVPVLALVIKAGASREPEILAEIRDAVFSFICKMEPKRVMDTMLVSRVRILYIRSLLARSPELQSIKVSPVERFLEKSYMTN